MKYIYKLSAGLLFLSLFTMFGSTLMLSKTQNFGDWEWVIYLSSLVILLSAIIVVFFRTPNSNQLHLEYQQCKINEDQQALQQQQDDIQEKLKALARKENEVKQKILNYQQYAEFPDHEGWQEDVSKIHFDEEIAQLLHDKAKVMFDKIIHKKYSENDVFNNQLILNDVVDLIESVARIHHPDSQSPLLETSIENLFRALNRLSLQLLVLLDSFPVNIKEYNLRKTYLYIQKSSKTFGYYKQAEPFLSFVTPVLRVGLIAANPVLGLAQTAAMEAGKHVIKKSSEKYALNLLHDFIAIIGEQATTIFGDSTLRYRSKHWIYALELTEISYHFYILNPEALAQALKIISGLLIRSEYDRIYLYHCIAQGKSANPGNYANDFLNNDDKRVIAKNLSEFLESYIDKDNREENVKKIIRWRTKAEQRMSIDIPLKLDQNDADYLKNRLSAGSPEKSIKPFLARYILSAMQDDEIPQFIYTDIMIEATVPLLSYKALWLIISNKRLLLISVDKEQIIKLLWVCDYKRNQSFTTQRRQRLVADDCLITGGTWQAELSAESEPVFIIKGRNMGSYESYFQVLEDLHKNLT